MNKQSNTGKSKLNKAGHLIPGYFPVKVAATEFLKDWKRSNIFIRKLRIPDETQESSDFPLLDSNQKRAIQRRLIRFFRVYSVLLILTPIAVLQSISKEFYSPILIALGFVIVSIAKMTECAFYSYQVRCNAFINLKEFLLTPKEWIPRH